MNKQQYVHKRVNVTCEKFSAELVFRAVNIKEKHNMKYDTMVVLDMLHHNKTIHGMLGLNLAMFRHALSNVYHKVAF